MKTFWKKLINKIINIVGKQGELLKKGWTFWLRWLRQSNKYFKIRLYKFLCKFPVLKKSSFEPFVLNLSFRKLYEILVYNSIIKLVSDWK